MVGATEGGGAAGAELERRVGFGRADRDAGACTSGAGPRGARADGDLLTGEGVGEADGERVEGAVDSPGIGSAESASTPPSMLAASATVYSRPPTAARASAQVTRRFRRPLRSTKIARSWDTPPRR